MSGERDFAMVWFKCVCVCVLFIWKNCLAYVDCRYDVDRYDISQYVIYIYINICICAYIKSHIWSVDLQMGGSF